MVAFVFFFVIIVILGSYFGAIGFLVWRAAKKGPIGIRLLCCLGIAVLLSPIVWDVGKQLVLEHRAARLLADIRDGFDEATFEDFLAVNEKRHGLSSWEKGNDNGYLVYFRNHQSFCGFFLMRNHVTLYLDDTGRALEKVYWSGDV